MKKIIFSLALLGFNCVGYAKESKPHKLYVGCESGVGLSKPKLEAFADHHFISPTSVKLAATGFHLGLELFRNTYFEIGLNEQTFTFNHVKHSNPDGSGFTSSGGGYNAFGTSLRLRYSLKLGKSIAILPMAGINIVSISSPSQTATTLDWSAAGAIESSQGTIYDTLFSSTSYFTNKLTTLECGTDISYALTSRLSIALGAYYIINPDNYASQFVQYTKTNQATETAWIYYGGNEVSAKLSLRWQLGTLVSPKRRTEQDSFYQNQ